MPKIITRIFFVIGNQLFIYAAARRMALVNNAELVLDHVSGFVRDFQYRRTYQLDHFNIPCRKATPTERLEPFSRIRRYLKKLHNKHLPFEKRDYLVQDGIDFDSRILSFKPKGTVYLEGYWQSEDYFKDVESQIREDLKIKPPTDILNQRMAEKIHSTNAVCLHVRFFDTINQLTDSSCNLHSEYYKQAIELMENKISNAHYFLFSDEPKFAQTIVPFSEDRFTIVDHNQGDSMAYADLWLMTQCKHFIIANSTFSWWGAWLGLYEDKIVVAPGRNIGGYKLTTAWGFKGLLPERWIKL